MRGRLLSSPPVYLAVSVGLALLTGLAFHASASRGTLAKASLGSQAQVVVAGRPIARGSVIRPSDLRVASMPAVYAPPGSFDRIGRAAGRVALTDLAQGEVATKTRLARVRAGPVASLTPEGLRAFAVPTSLPAGSVAPGDHVDILATYGGAQPHTETVVSAVEVLLVLGPVGLGGAGHQPGVGLDAAGSGAGNSLTLIVLVGPDQEGRLAYARAFSNLDVAVAPSGAGPG